MSSPLILVVDDDADIRMNMALALEFAGYEVLTASNGEQALEVLRGLTDPLRVGCILLDLMMPKMDGVQFLEVIKSQHSHDLANIPVVIATAKGGPVQGSAVLERVTILKKPIDLDDLYRIVEQICGVP